eukprot:356355-Chlamydomonas_euryale.AAC.7
MDAHQSVACPPRTSQHLGVPPHRQHPGAPPHHQHLGAPPHRQHPGAPPHHQHPGAPPHHQHPGAPPHHQHPGAPTHHQHPGAPTHHQHPGAPPHHQHPGALPHRQHPGAPPHHQHPGAPPHRAAADPVGRRRKYHRQLHQAVAGILAGVSDAAAAALHVRRVHQACHILRRASYVAREGLARSHAARARRHQQHRVRPARDAVDRRGASTRSRGDAVAGVARRRRRRRGVVGAEAGDRDVVVRLTAGTARVRVHDRGAAATPERRIQRKELEGVVGAGRLRQRVARRLRRQHQHRAVAIERARAGVGVELRGAVRGAGRGEELGVRGV